MGWGAVERGCWCLCEVMRTNECGEHFLVVVARGAAPLTNEWRLAPKILVFATAVSISHFSDQTQSHSSPKCFTREAHRNQALPLPGYGQIQSVQEHV